jgi:hypothetical protein
LLQKRGDSNLAAEQYATALQLEPSMKVAEHRLAELRGPKGGENATAAPGNAGQQAAAAEATPPAASSQGPAVEDLPGRGPQPPPPVATLPPRQSLPTVLPQLPPPAASIPYPAARPGQVMGSAVERTPPVPQYTPDYPAFPQQRPPASTPSAYPAPFPATTGQPAGPVGGNSTAWPLYQPSQVPNVSQRGAGVVPPVPSVVTNVYAQPTRLPPVRQATAAWPGR